MEPWNHCLVNYLFGLLSENTKLRQFPLSFPRSRQLYILDFDKTLRIWYFHQKKPLLPPMGFESKELLPEHRLPCVRHVLTQRIQTLSYIHVMLKLIQFVFSSVPIVQMDVFLAENSSLKCFKYFLISVRHFPCFCPTGMIRDLQSAVFVRQERDLLINCYQFQGSTYLNIISELVIYQNTASSAPEFMNSYSGDRKVFYKKAAENF